MVGTPARARGLCGLLAPLVFTASWVTAGLVQSRYSVQREDVSALAAESARHAWIMIGGLVLAGVLTAAFAPALPRVLGGGRAARLGAALVALCGLGLVGLGALRNDCSSRTTTCEARVDAGLVSWHHTAHDVLSVPVFAASVAAPAVLGLCFRRHAVLAPLASASLAVAAALAGLLAANGLEAAPGWHGAIQRAAASLAFAWLGAVALRLLRSRAL